jgi:hypothetical protein
MKPIDMKPIGMENEQMLSNSVLSQLSHPAMSDVPISQILHTILDNRQHQPVIHLLATCSP